MAGVHAAIEAESAALYRRFSETGRMARAEEFPAVAALYRAAVTTFKQGRQRGDFFTYQGRRYRWEVTTAGRMRVLHPKTRKVLIVGGPFALW